MKKLKINSAAAIIDIVGACLYVVVLFIAFTAQNYLEYLTIINFVTMSIWYFSLAASIFNIFAFMKSRKVRIRTTGIFAGIIGHLFYFLFGIYAAPMSLVLCIVGAFFTFKLNTYHEDQIQPVRNEDAIDVEAIEIREENIDESK